MAAADHLRTGIIPAEPPDDPVLEEAVLRKVTWRLIPLMFVGSAWSFYLLRFLLGLAEAGFFPGIVLYLSGWFPARQRARAMARFMTGSAVTGIVGGPLSGAILQYMDGQAGLAGWQWLF